MVSVRGVAALIVASGLAACVENTGPAQPDGAAMAPERGPLVVDAAGRQVTVAPPEGYCVDPGSLREHGRNLYVTLEDCSAPADDGVALVSIGGGPLVLAGAGDFSAALQDLAAFLETEEGLRGAGMGGDADSVTIIETRMAKNTLYVLVEDSGELVAPALGPRFWRAFTEVNGRALIASMGVEGETSAAAAASRETLGAIVAALREANPAGRGGGARPAAPAARPTTAVTAPPPSPRG